MNRRNFIQGSLAGLMLGSVAQIARASAPLHAATSELSEIAAAWRGPNKADTYIAGVLQADWKNRKLSIRNASSLPTRPHGIHPDADGCLLVVGVRPGNWLLRIDSKGQIQTHLTLPESEYTRLNGHALIDERRQLVFTTETDYRNGQGKIGVRDYRTLQKLDEWNSAGTEPHQLVLDEKGHLMVANGGIRRSLEDKKLDLDRMDSSLAHIHGTSGELINQWKLADRRLSLRHLAWSYPNTDGSRLLGIAMQAEHSQIEQRQLAPTLAVFDGQQLLTPSTSGDQNGYAGDLCAALNGGFILSSNQSGTARLWHPARAEQLLSIVELPECYALTNTGPRGYTLISTSLGLVRWHSYEAAVFIPWPQPMALDNHWSVLG